MLRQTPAFLFLFFSMLRSSFAQAPFDVPGFAYSGSLGGFHYYACRAAACGINSTSFEYQDEPQDFSLRTFEDHMRGAFDALASRGGDRTILEIGRPTVRSAGPLKVWKMTMSFSQGGRQPNYVVGGFITGGSRRVSLISGGGSAAAANSNFENFLQRLVPLIRKGAPL